MPEKFTLELQPNVCTCPSSCSNQFESDVKSPAVVLCVSSSTTASSLTLYLGRQKQEGTNSNEVSRGVMQIINHPDYNSVTSDNDISLLKLSEPVTFNNFILPVCLAAAGSTFHNGTDTWITGWGNIGFGGGSATEGVTLKVFQIDSN